MVGTPNKKPLSLSVHALHYLLPICGCHSFISINFDFGIFFPPLFFCNPTLSCTVQKIKILYLYLDEARWRLKDLTLYVLSLTLVFNFLFLIKLDLLLHVKIQYPDIYEAISKQGARGGGGGWGGTRWVSTFKGVNPVFPNVKSQRKSNGRD